ncbi:MULTISPECIES: hypothetical protein [unclassified Bartonella]|uniref:hypothetical protein n=1 Tax=unclassified Bartonella TaxID=2645622 RepID=UPI0035D04281
MKFKKELNALKEKINKVIEHVKRSLSEVCRRTSCNIFQILKRAKKVFSQTIAIMPYFYHSFFVCSSL